MGPRRPLGGRNFGKKTKKSRFFIEISGFRRFGGGFARNGPKRVCFGAFSGSSEVGISAKKRKKVVFLRNSGLFVGWVGFSQELSVVYDNSEIWGWVEGQKLDQKIKKSDFLIKFLRKFLAQEFLKSHWFWGHLVQAFAAEPANACIGY